MSSQGVGELAGSPKVALLIRHDLSAEAVHRTEQKRPFIIASCMVVAGIEPSGLR
jgi:hypothetical protein